MQKLHSITGMVRQAVIIAFVATVLLVVPSLHRPFFSRGEPREALVAAGMLLTGDWVSPPAYDNTVPSKPPFTHWLMAGLSLPVGYVTEVTARLPSALSTLAFIPFFVAFVALRTTPNFGLLAGLMLLSSPEWFRAATSCRVDTVLATSMAGGMLALFSWHERARKGLPFVAIALLTIATLTKGPIGFCLPGAIFGTFLLFRGEVKGTEVLRLIRNVVVVIAPVLLLSSIWYILGYLDRGDEFIEKVWYENFQRLSGTMEDEPHEHGIVYLWGLTFVGLLPWSIGIFAWIPFWYFGSGSSRSSQKISAAKVFKNLNPLLQFSLIATCITLLLFSLPSSKRSVYILPAYPFIAILLAACVERCAPMLEFPLRVVRGFSSVVIVLSFVVVAVLLLGAFPWIASLSPSTFTETQIAQLVEGAVIGFTEIPWILEMAFVVATVIVASAAMGVRNFREILSNSSTVRTGVLFSLAVAVANAFPLTAVAPSISLKNWLYTSEVIQRAELKSDEIGYSFKNESYDVSFYLQLPFRRVETHGCPERGLLVLQSRNIGKYEQECGRNIEVLGAFSPVGEPPGKSITFARLVGHRPIAPSGL